MNRNEAPDATSADSARPVVSVVIPTLDETAYLARTLESLGPTPAARREAGIEIVLADGGSRDGTPGLAKELGVDRVVVSPAGRARQLRAGVSVASGELILFLHADTRLEPGAIDELREVMKKPSVSGGAFRLQIDARRWWTWLVAKLVNLRSRAFGLPYGDQGIFVRRSVLDQMGGVPELPIMEDVELARQMRRHGRLRLLNSAAITSGRRWEANGLLRTTLVNWSAVLMYRFRVPPRLICRFYERGLRRRR
ncbi:MAG: TIGR04283 family arsenosugar biosynthesis glycosyltransferase [Phycisphaeraceae bacterium]